MDDSAPRQDAALTAYVAPRIWPLIEPGSGSLVDHAVLVSEGRIESIVPRGELPQSAATQDLGDVDLVPGFIDVQVNGGGGALFNDDPSVEGIRTIFQAHRRYGTTSLLPTFITDGLPAMKAARAAVDECLRNAEPGVLGVHFEGPFLDERKTGAHDREHVRAPSSGDLEVITSSASAGITLLTLSANRYTDEVAAALNEAGIIVALGHCASTFDEATDAFARGVTGVTHLFNAMSPLESRAPGLVGAALASGAVRCGLILDGVHVDYGAAKAALRALGRDRMMLVTDAVQPVGTDMIEFSLGGQRVRLEGTRCINEEGNLAGSALEMIGAIRNAVQHLDLSLEEAVWLATRSPAAFLGLEHEIGALRPGMRADFTLLDPSLNVAGTVVRGALETN